MCCLSKSEENYKLWLHKSQEGVTVVYKYVGCKSPPERIMYHLSIRLLSRLEMTREREERSKMQGIKTDPMKERKRTRKRR
jgi:hypothetical protein